MPIKALLIVVSAIIALSGCQSMAPHSGTGGAQPAPPQRTAGAAPPRTEAVQRTKAPESMPVDLWQRIRSGLSWQSINNAEVDRVRDNFLGQHDYFPVVAARATFYLHYIVEEVERRDMPMEIALLPLVESTLDPLAYSSKRAAGLWQIMPSTGRYLGLESNWWYDGRRDLRDATRAALDYLETLHRDFDGDWLLALSAYNSGKTRVRRVRRHNQRQGLGTDFWSLRLPSETRAYVPKLIALAQIVAEPQAYGVVIPAVSNTAAFEVAETGGQIEMARAAELAGVALHTLRTLNPGHLRWATSPDTTELLLPAGSGERFSAGVASLTADERVRWRHYRIERGDSLVAIARTFETDVTLLREVNDIQGSLIRAGDTLLVPKGSGWAASLAMADKGPPQAKGYRVRRGDSLYRIAGKFNVSVNDIIAWNALDPRQYLKPGQTLTLYVGGS
jgi:membrane-bound lytic murein transglycosylase D